MPCCKLVASVFAATAAAETRKKHGFLPFLTPNPSSEIILEVAYFISAIADLILEVAGIILEITEIALAVAEIILEVSEMILEVAETSSVNAFFSFAVAEALQRWLIWIPPARFSGLPTPVCARPGLKCCARAVPAFPRFCRLPAKKCGMTGLGKLLEFPVLV